MRKLEEWIEVMEDEEDKAAGRALNGKRDVKQKQLEKLSLLLKHSPPDQVVFDNLRRLRRLIAQSGDPANAIEEMISGADFTAKLHGKIMDQITSVGKRRPKRKQRQDKSASHDGDPGSSLGPYKS